MDYGPGLRHSIRRRLRARAVQLELIDEIASRVWCELVSDNGRALEEFDPARGSLSTYLSLLGREHAHRLLKKRRRRSEREVRLGRRDPVDRSTPLGPTRLMMQEFSAGLTLRERRYLRIHLLKASDGCHAMPLSLQNIWQMKHRILQKFLRFLRG